MRSKVVNRSLQEKKSRNKSLKQLLCSSLKLICNYHKEPPLECSTTTEDLIWFTSYTKCSVKSRGCTVSQWRVSRANFTSQSMTIIFLKRQSNSSKNYFRCDWKVRFHKGLLNAMVISTLEKSRTERHTVRGILSKWTDTIQGHLKTQGLTVCVSVTSIYG